MAVDQSYPRVHATGEMCLLMIGRRASICGLKVNSTPPHGGTQHGPSLSNRDQSSFYGVNNLTCSGQIGGVATVDFSKSQLSKINSSTSF